MSDLVSCDPHTAPETVTKENAVAPAPGQRVEIVIKAADFPMFDLRLSEMAWLSRIHVGIAERDQ